MSAEHDPADDGGLNTLQSRRELLKAGGATLATAGLAGCTRLATDGYGSGDDTATPHPDSEEAQEYQCRDDVYTVNIVLSEDVGHNWPEEGGDEYIAELAKQSAEYGLEQVVHGSDQYNDYKVFIDDDKFWSDHSNGFALFEAPVFKNERVNAYEASGERAHHTDILLRKNGMSSLLGLAVTNFSGELCDSTTQAAIVNYSNLLGSYDQREGRSVTDEWIPLVENNEIADQLIENAIVTTLPHEASPGHLGNMTHPDGITKVWSADEFEDAENDRWWSSMMSSFYGLAASMYGLYNSCSRKFEPPEFTGGAMGEVIWETDLYLRNHFSRCAAGEYVDAADLDGDQSRDPAFNEGPNGDDAEFNALNGVPGETVGEAIEAWSENPAIKAEEERTGTTLEEAWEGLEDAQLTAQNIEGLTAMAEYEDATEEQREVILTVRDMFRQAIERGPGSYKAQLTTDTTTFD